MQDLQLIADIRSGNMMALETIMDAHSSMLKRMAFMMLKDAALAEDATQETFIKFYYSIDRFRGDASIKTYLAGILVNECRQKLRRGWLKRVLPIGGTYDSQTDASDKTNYAIAIAACEAGTVALEMEEASAVKLDLTDALVKLDGKSREVLLLHYYSDLSIKDICNALGEPEGTIKSRLKRAREKLKVLTGEELENA